MTYEIQGIAEQNEIGFKRKGPVLARFGQNASGTSQPALREQGFH
jgi:hypothetical protein